MVRVFSHASAFVVTMTPSSPGEFRHVTTADYQRAPPLDSKALPLRRGLLVSALLAVLFLLSTAYISIVTLIDRVDSTDVMKAVSHDIWTAKIGGQVAYFCVAQLALHLAMGALAWLLARASAEIWPSAREKFIRVLIGWFCLFGGAALAYNALWYPRTFFGAHYFDYMVPEFGPFHVGEWIYGVVVIAACATLATGGYLALRRMHSLGRRRWLAGAAGVIALTATGLAAQHLQFTARAHAAGGPPHVILLGIDSLRLGELSRFGGTNGNTSHIDRFLEDADLVKDTSTPMARTFGSWVAILTGRSPSVTGARNNLTPRDVVVANPTIADVLRKAGYRTVYSTDEVRFANIDQSYGFERVITPPIGASDFIIGTYNELPLASVVLNTRIGQLLFPFSYGNRGAATMFEPKTYLARLDRELDFEKPTFLVVHLTAAHWPYFTAETPFGITKQTPDDRPMYRVGLRTADAMFEQVASMLRRKGALENAIVVVLSDHGEAMMLPDDAIAKHGAFVQGLGAPLKVLDVGHGQSVLSPTQYKVLLAFKSFAKDRGFSSGARDLPAVATVEDIAPTLLDLLGVDASALQASGQSLAPLLRTPDAVPAVTGPERIRFTETDLAVIPNFEGGVDEVTTARTNSKFFGIDPATSRMYIRHELLPLAHAYKERAAFTSRHLLAALPAGPDAHQYLYFDLQSGNGQLLLERPGPEPEDAQRLWDALEAHFPGELRSPTRVMLADWPAIDKAWRDFFVTRGERAVSGAPAATTMLQSVIPAQAHEIDKTT